MKKQLFIALVAVSIPQAIMSSPNQSATKDIQSQISDLEYDIKLLETALDSWIQPRMGPDVKVMVDAKAGLRTQIKKLQQEIKRLKAQS